MGLADVLYVVQQEVWKVLKAMCAIVTESS